MTQEPDAGCPEQILYASSVGSLSETLTTLQQFGLLERLSSVRLGATGMVVQLCARQVAQSARELPPTDRPPAKDTEPEPEPPTYEQILYASSLGVDEP